MEVRLEGMEGVVNFFTGKTKEAEGKVIILSLSLSLFSLFLEI